MENKLIFFYMAQPPKTTQNSRLKVVPTVETDGEVMFPFGCNRKCTSYQTETFKIPKRHITYSLANKIYKVYKFKCNSIQIMSCKKNSYNLLYQNLSDQKTIGDKIRCVRLHAGLTIEQLAQIIKVDRTTLIRNETNGISEDFIKTNILLKIEDACSVPRYSLFDEYLLYYETQQLKIDRKSYGLKQSDLAKFLNVSKNTISRWERKTKRPSREVWRSTIKLFQDLKFSATSKRSLCLSLIDNDDSSKSV